MATEYRPPLAIHFIWSPADEKSVRTILDAVRISFARDVDRPFSRGLNIPLFFYSSENPCQCPSDLPEQQASRDIVFVFTGVNTLGQDSWKSYINKLSSSNTLRVVPIAIDKEGLGHSSDGSLKDLNFIRLYEWPRDLKEQYALLSMAHEIYRHGFTEIDKKNQASVRQ